MDADTLLRRIAPLPFPERQRRLAEHARAEAGTPQWPTLLLDLQTRGRHGRRCALLLAEVARDIAYVRTALVVGSPDERDHTLTVAVKLGLPVADVVALLPHLSRAGRQNLIRSVRRYGTSEVADALLPAVQAALGDVAAAGVLPACSTAVVAEHVEDLGWAVASWGALGHRHPGVVLDHVESTLTAAPRALWTDELARLAPGVAAASPHDPARVLAIVERCAPEVVVPPQVVRRFAALARHDPARLAAVLLQPGARAVTGRALVEALSPLPDEVLARLLAAAPPYGWPGFLRHLPPPRRTAVHRYAAGESGAATAVGVLDVLPWAERHDLARRALARHDVADHPLRRLEVIARLPFAEAEAELAALTREPAAERRALGYTLLLTALGASRDPVVIARVLTRLTRLPNEQDPVRLAAVRGVADLPARLLTADAATAAAQVVVAAVAAPDASWATRAGAGRIATGLVGEGLVSDRAELVDAGFTALAAVGRGRHADHFPGLSRVLPRAADQRVFDALAPRFRAEARVGEFGAALSLADALGTERTARLPALGELLAAATRAKDDSVVRQAIRLWLAPSATRDERVARLLADDRSTITIPEVAGAVAARRTDLLDDVLRRPARGRFLPRRVQFLPAIGEWSDRWNPVQVSTFRAAAAALAGDAAATVHHRVAGVGQLRRVPGSDAELRRLTVDPDAVVAEVALAALAASDDPSGVVPELAAAAATDRSRVAVPALRRCLDRMPPAEVAGPIQVLLTAPKVTVRKDAVRLVVELATPDAVGIVQRSWRTPGEHRDVRRAVPPSLRSQLDDDRSWVILAEAVADPATASAVLDVAPVGVAPRYRARWAQLLLDVLDTTDDDAVARAALDALGRWVRFAPTEVATALAAVVTDLGRTGRWRAALPGLVQSAAILADPADVVEVARRLLARGGTADDVDAGDDRDRPVGQRLVALSEEVSARAHADPALRARLVELVDTLAADDLTRDLAVGVAVASVAWDADPAAGLAQVVALADSPLLAVSAAAAVAARLRSVVGTVEASTFAAAVAVLTADTSVASALVRLAVVDVAGGHAGWPPQWRDRLRELRVDPNVDVVRAALRVVTAAE